MKKDLNNYIKIGRISMPVSKKANVVCADICVDNNHILHIIGQHKKELSQLGMTAFDYVTLIAKNYTRIYKDKKTKALYLSVYSGNDRANSAVIEINYIGKLRWWEIKTAAPFRTAFFKSKLLIWERERTS
jgi:hypothetical protein